MEIRPATLADLAALVPLFDGYRRFYRQPSDPARAERFLRERLERAESVVFLALDEGEALGFVQLYPSFWSVAACRSWILNDLYVVPERRGEGIATALLECARRHAATTGAGGLSLATERTNRSAQRLYEKHGWLRDEEFLHYELPVSS